MHTVRLRICQGEARYWPALKELKRQRVTAESSPAIALVTDKKANRKLNARDVIVIGSSAGGLQPLKELIRGLPADLEAAVFVVRHIGTAADNGLPHLLEQAGQLKATQASDCEQFEHGHIYVAPPDRHLLLEAGRIVLSNGPKENRTRPAIDPLFRSAAVAFRSRVVGVVLSGALDDGTAGLWSVKQHGGVTVVQDPNEASSPSMPRNALKYVEIDHCRPAAEIGSLLAQLARDPVADNGPADDEAVQIENRIAMGDTQALHNLDRIGKLTHFACPECHGTLWEMGHHPLLRFRCRSGHANSGANLITEQSEITENLLLLALRETEENPTLCRYLGEYAREHDDRRAADFFLSQTAEHERKAHLIHQALANNHKLPVINGPSEWPELSKLNELDAEGDLEPLL